MQWSCLLSAPAKALDNADSRKNNQEHELSPDEYNKNTALDQLRINGNYPTILLM